MRSQPHGKLLDGAIMTKVLLICSLLAFSMSVLTFTPQKTRRTAYLEVKPDSELLGYVIRSTESVHLTDCGRSCLRTVGCNSVNFKEKRSLCELNSQKAGAAISQHHIIPKPCVVYAQLMVSAFALILLIQS